MKRGSDLRRCGKGGYKGSTCGESPREKADKLPANPVPNNPQYKSTKIGKKPGESTIKNKHSTTALNNHRPPPSPVPPANSKKKTGEGTETMEQHHISLALDSGMMKGKERMTKFTIAKVVEMRGYIDSSKLAELLRTQVDDQWNWEPRSLKDGRYIVECPSAETARQLEKAGQMVSQVVTLTFTPWTTDLYRPTKAEGALRWVIVRNLPMFCWDRDSMARMLKPAGDLVHVGGCGTTAAEDVRVFLRIRRPRLLPCVIHCSIATLQHTYTIELDSGEPTLP
ncbi:hypothetical protein J5N97_003758 [Dioscorea zingiberensis]|uniref:DUF4283 domain-containing protein n=1 Tax=Dioscorea zingiberensis TaxID=325984 RepID=A0A9D5D6K6_9LILI|nr:hypothetical protein J5N97_003758 [Dioscorea zingiberensis]